MKRLTYGSGAAFGAILFSGAAHAGAEEVLDTIFRGAWYGFIVFVALVFAAVFFHKSRDRRRTPLQKLFEEGSSVHSVGPNTPVIECVRKMAKEKVGAVIVLEGERLVGIFTERDALNKVLAVGMDPGSTNVSAVMTRDPYCFPPTTTVGDAMEVVTKRRFRHLPVVDNGRVLAVVSNRDLTRWLVKDQVEEVQELVELAESP